MSLNLEELELKYRLGRVISFKSLWSLLYSRAAKCRGDVIKKGSSLLQGSVHFDLKCRFLLSHFTPPSSTLTILLGLAVKLKMCYCCSSSQSDFLGF